MIAENEWIANAFALTNCLRVLFYLPQIAAIARSVDRARDIAVSTWCMWLLNNLIGAIYGGLVAHGRGLALSFAACAAACGLTIVLVLLKRLHSTGLSATPP